jgi:hypothetical protein
MQTVTASTPIKTIAEDFTEGKTVIEKSSHHGWTGSTFFEGANGKGWEITTMKMSDKRIYSTCQEGKIKRENGYVSFSFTLCGTDDSSRRKRIACSYSAIKCTEKSVTEIHKLGLEKFKQLTDVDFKIA